VEEIVKNILIRIINKCNNCRIGRCDECPNRCPEKYKLCFMCHNFKHLR